MELISLTESPISFNRLFASFENYYHWHQCLEILYIEQGYGIAIVDNQQYTMRAGRLFIFPPYKLHKIMIDSSQTHHYKRTIIHLDNIVLSNYLSSFPLHQKQLQQLCHKKSPARVYDLSENKLAIDMILSIYHQQFTLGENNFEYIACLILQILALLPKEGVASDFIDESLSVKVMQWVETHYQQKFRLSQLAKDLSLSQSHISRRFKMETGELIHDYLQTRRIKQSCELLRNSSMSIKEIATKIGFSDSTYFISSFKKTMGKTPLNYKKN